MTRDYRILRLFLIKILYSHTNIGNILLGQKDTGVGWGGLGDRVLSYPGFASNSLQMWYEQQAPFPFLLSLHS